MRFSKFLLTLPLAALLAMPTSGYADVGSKDGTDITVSGEFRTRPESQQNYDFNSDVKSDDRKFIGQRTRINIDFKAGDDVSGLLQVQDSRTWGGGAGNGTAATGNSNTGSGREKEALDFYQAYVQVNNLWGSNVSAKVGRQTLVYGSQRLLGHLGWHDNARAFDAYKLMIKLGGGQIDLIAAKLNDPDGFNVAGTGEQDMNGIYTTWDVSGHKLDVYYLGWAQETGGRDVRTSGARLAGKQGPVDYTLEFAVQGGDWSKSGNTTVSQSANAMSVDAGYKFGGSHRIGLQYNAGSGDDESDATAHKNFIFPFHTNHAHYGHMDQFNWGNMTDLAIRYSGKPFGKTLVKLDYHIFNLQQAKGTWVSVVGGEATTGLRAANSTYTKKDLGTEVDLTLVQPYNKNAKIVLGYSMFMPGNAVKERNSQKGDTATWSYAMLVVNF